MYKLQKFTFLILATLGFAFSAHADSQSVMISVNKNVRQAQAEEYAQKLERRDFTTGTCYMQVHVRQYIPYPSCTTDATCPYWGVALTTLEWRCDLPLKSWLDEILKDANYTIFSDGPIGPFPVVSGGN